MTTLKSEDRQPDKLDYASPTQFRFKVNKLPLTEFFVQSVNIPGVTLNEVTQPTSLAQVKLAGEGLEYEDLTVGFLVDENLNNFTEIYDWLKGLGFPQEHAQFTTLVSQAKERFPTQTSSSGIYSDGTVIVLSSKNNPVVEIRFRDLFPKNLASLQYTQDASDVTYLTGSVTFGYKFYEIVKL